MSSIAVETFDPAVHRNHMPEVFAPKAPRQVLVVAVGKFRLHFLSQAQLCAAIEFFRNPLGSTRRSATGGDHWEFQPWQSRLPAGINNGHNRPRILTALEKARLVASEHLP